MDEITLLREMDADVAPLTAEARRAARDRLTEQMRRPARRRAFGFITRSAAWRVGIIAAGATVLLAVGAVVHDPDSPAPGPEPAEVQPVSAAQVLDRAAEVSRKSEKSNGPAPRGDQFIYTKEVLEERPVGKDGPVETFTDENWRSVDDSKTSLISERGKTWEAPPLAENQSVWPPTGYAELAELPTDPDTLLLAMRDPFVDPDPGTAPDRPLTDAEYAAAYDNLTMLLYGWRVMPPGLRAAAYEVLAKLPDVNVVDTAVDANGRMGIGISREPSMGTAIIIDRETYEYLGMRDILVKDNGEKVAQVSSLVDSGIVDKAGRRP